MELMTAINKAGLKGSFSYKVKVTSMVSGLFKSSFLHLIIILMFMYGAEILKEIKNLR